jgi:hypothetical protein
VVGTDEDTVTLLYVADADGWRVNTGELVTVGREELDGFDWVVNPDGNRPPRVAVASRLEMMYWSVRVFAQRLAAHPLSGAGTLALVIAGSLGNCHLPFADPLAGVLILVGSLGLVYVGSGRL